MLGTVHSEMSRLWKISSTATLIIIIIVLLAMLIFVVAIFYYYPYCGHLHHHYHANLWNHYPLSNIWMYILSHVCSARWLVGGADQQMDRHMAGQ